jgi:hypothetical protein
MGRCEGRTDHCGRPRIMKGRRRARRESMAWLAFGQPEDRTPTHGYEATREAAMTAFAKSWRRE